MKNTESIHDGFSKLQNMLASGDMYKPSAWGKSAQVGVK